jgi:hypothetical protein
MNCLRSLERWDRGLESHSRLGFVRVFILCLCWSVWRMRPCDGLIPVQGVFSAVYRITYLLTELIFSWGAINWAATQELPSISWNPKVQYRVHWSLSWAISIESTPSHLISLRSIFISSTHQRLGLPSGLFPSGFPPISYMHSPSPHSCYMPGPSHPSWLDHSNYTLWRVQVMKLTMQFSPISCYFIPLWSKYPSQHPVLKHPQSMFLP